MNFFNNPNRIPESYGLKIAGGLIAFFLIMKIAGLAHHYELRFLNVFIQVGGIYFAIKKFKQTHEEHMNYFRALITGVATGAVGSAVFAIFLFAYMSLDTTFMQGIIENEPMGRYLNPYITAFMVALEGLFSGLLFTFIIINYVDTDDVNDPQGESN
jgi:ABC-type Fe3+-siderophore transport system permease subunit